MAPCRPSGIERGCTARTAVHRPPSGICRLRDYSALRASPLRGRPAGDQRRCAPLSNPACMLSGVRIFSVDRHGANGGPQTAKRDLPTEGFEPPTYGLQNRCTTAVLSRRRRDFIIPYVPQSHVHRPVRPVRGPTIGIRSSGGARMMRSIAHSGRRLAIRLVLAMAAFALTGGSALAHHREYASRAAPGDFSYYLLSLSWSPAFCAESHGAAECAGPKRLWIHRARPMAAAGSWTRRILRRAHARSDGRRTRDRGLDARARTRVPRMAGARQL